VCVGLYVADPRVYCGPQTFVEKGTDEQTQAQVIARDFVPAMMDPILGDYARNVPDARCRSKLISLAAYYMLPRLSLYCHLFFSGRGP